MPETEIIVLRLRVKTAHADEVKGQLEDFVDDFLDPEIATIEGEIETENA